MVNTNLSKLLEAVERGEEITIARAGRPIADLMPHRHRTPLRRRHVRPHRLTRHVLLDSHIVLWLVSTPDRLGPIARNRVDSADVLHVSAATIWEPTITAMLGKLTIPDDFEQRLWSFGFKPLDVSPRHANGLRSFPGLVRHNPFDRLLLAQAQVEALDLLTVDRVLLDLELPFVVDADL